MAPLENGGKREGSRRFENACSASVSSGRIDSGQRRPSHEKNEMQEREIRHSPFYFLLFSVSVIDRFVCYGWFPFANDNKICIGGMLALFSFLSVCVSLLLVHLSSTRPIRCIAS